LGQGVAQGALLALVFLLFRPRTRSPGLPWNSVSSGNATCDARPMTRGSPGGLGGLLSTRESRCSRSCSIRVCKACISESDRAGAAAMSGEFRSTIPSSIVPSLSVADAAALASPTAIEFQYMVLTITKVRVTNSIGNHRFLVRLVSQFLHKPFI